MISVKQVKHRIKRTKESLLHLERTCPELSVHGYWSKGYFQGKLSVLENLLDELEEMEEDVE